MSQLKISVAQFGATRDLEANRRISRDLIAKAAPETDLVVLPENAMYSDPAKESDENYSEALDGPYVTAICEAAKEHGVHVIAGFTETNGDEPPYNALVYVTDQGELGAVYRKIHLYDAFGYKESDKVTAADISNPLVVDINGVKVGAATCYDLRFPEMSRWLIDHGAEVIVLPAAWVVGPMKEFHWETLVRARAIENTAYFAACGQTGPGCTGQSMIIDPMGTVVASAGEAAESIATAVIDTERVAQVRQSNPSLANRRFTVAPKQ